MCVCVSVCVCVCVCEFTPESSIRFPVLVLPLSEFCTNEYIPYGKTQSLLSVIFSGFCANEFMYLMAKQSYCCLLYLLGFVHIYESMYFMAKHNHCSLLYFLWVLRSIVHIFYGKTQ